ncbi:protein-L-isoaspartate O-methyltransferase family protein [Sphingorhabdus sp.]|uniref:protein-L-isoaspartate O-methyltransferase family protein n=1 Tax=Sphingorhabdus sp. TaxID=1902408 RepID=UPI00391CF2D3
MESVNFEDMRRSMVDSQLRTSGVTDAWVIGAMGTIAREDYVPASHRATAYMDRAILGDDGNVLNPPVSIALLLQAAEVRPDDKVLLVSQADGYVAAILRARVAQLTTVAADNISAAQSAAPFTLIIIDGAAEELPTELLSLAEDGARLVTGVTEGAVARLAKGYVHNRKVALKSFADSEIAPVAAFARKPEFVF